MLDINPTYRISQLLFEGTARVLFKLKVSGRENVPKRPYVVISNHNSYLDPALIGIVCRGDHVDFMAKRELFGEPFFGSWARAVGAIPLNRDDSLGSGLKESIKRIKRGRVISMFPEGTRSLDGSIQRAQKGVGFLIGKADIPVLPIYIKNSGIALTSDGKINRGTSVAVYAGKTISPDDPRLAGYKAKKDYQAIADMAMESVTELKERCDAEKEEEIKGVESFAEKR
ncbi:MAG: 1-acyl-sn-glycerol-3-phosphate acyltransferase [Candidatus Omnitrophica bacterium]|nr:1-acyl-sn-glycerol-3-phosphate acyltransferase [Candidatus Omnitrophota bacterium]